MDNFKKYVQLYHDVLAINHNLVVNATVNLDGMLNSFTVDGFSKSGQVRFLRVDDPDVIAVSDERYSESTEIRDVDDIVYLAFKWWNRSVGKDHAVPEVWKDEWLRRGMLKVKVQPIIYERA